MPQTLHCPKCKQAVTVGDQSAGKRVTCPHCSQTFLAPGITAVESDDDDWLQLDTDPQTGTGPQTPATDPANSSAPTMKPPLPRSQSGSEADILNKFGAELEEFTAGIEPLPSSGSDDPFSDLPPANTPSSPLATTSAPQANDVEHQSEYRVTCPVCGSIMFAKASQEGQQIKCSDCLSSVKVPPPPKVKKTQSINIEQAATYSFEGGNKKERPADPFRKSADELLRAAEQVEDEEETPDYDFDAPSVRDWAKTVFGIFLDPGVTLHWIGLSTLAAVPAFIALSLESPILVVGLFVGALVLSAFVVACGFAIMQSVANEHGSVTDWPEMDPTAWFDDLIVAIGAASLAGIPAWALTSFLFGPSLLSVAITMFSIYLLFPFFLLSMMDMQSVFAPFSPEVARSASTCQESWGGLYLSSGLLFFGLFLLFAAMTGSAPGPVAVISIFATIGIAFMYFAMIGRLAYAIGQDVNEPGRTDTNEANTEA